MRLTFRDSVCLWSLFSSFSVDLQELHFINKKVSPFLFRFFFQTSPSVYLKHSNHQVQSCWSHKQAESSLRSFPGVCSYKEKFYKPGESFRRGCDKCFCHHFGFYCFEWVWFYLSAFICKSILFGSLTLLSSTPADQRNPPRGQRSVIGSEPTVVTQLFIRRTL